MVGSPAAVGGPRRCKGFEADAGPISGIEGEGKENLVVYVKQRQMLPFLGHKTVKEWLQEHTDTSMMGRYKSKKGMPVLIDQSIFVLYSNRPLVRDS